MTELINKEELLRRIKYFGREIPKDIVIEIIASMKEDIIRCKDCKHKYITGITTQYYVCDFMDIQYKDNGYCHCGERNEE